MSLEYNPGRIAQVSKSLKKVGLGDSPSCR